MATPLPNFVIVGAARSGSTSLYRDLRAHPQVFLPERKELHFFDKHWDLGLDWYQAQYAGAGGQAALGDATPTYMYKAHAVDRMAATLPGARLIAILRNPVDRAYSHFWMNRSQWKERLTFEEALAAEPARLAAGEGRRRRGVPGSCAYADRGRYLYQLQRLCKHYPRHRLLVLILEADLRVAPEVGYGAVCRFLEIDDTFEAPERARAANRSVSYRIPSLGRVMRRLPRPLPGPVAPMVRALARVNERPLTYPPMEPAIRARLLAQFRPHNEALASWLGRDLSMWEH